MMVSRGLLSTMSFGTALLLLAGCSEPGPTSVVDNEGPPQDTTSTTPQTGWVREYPAFHGDGVARMMALWGSSADHMVAVGCRPIATTASGAVLRDTGSGWSLAHEVEWCANGVWGSGPNNVFVVGSTLGGGGGARVTRYDGSGWQEMALPSNADLGLNSVWGSGPASVFAVGNDGNAVRFDGNRWNKMFSGTLVRLNAVWGTSPSNVWAVGDQGVIRRYDGSEWQAVSGPVDARLTGIWGASADTIYAVGYNSDGGVLIRFNGESWSVVADALFIRYGTGSITGTSGSDVYFGTSASGGRVGGTRPILYHYSGTGAPTVVSDLPPIGPVISTAVDAPFLSTGPWGNSETGIHLLGEEMAIVKLQDDRWHVSHGMIGGSDVWAHSGTLAFRVGRAGSILRYDGHGWRMMPTPTHATLYSIWGSSPTDVYASGGALLHYDGSEWRDITAQLPAGISRMGDVTGRSSQEVYLSAVMDGRMGVVRYDGNRWSVLPGLPESASPSVVLALWLGPSETMVLSGNQAEALHFEAGSWITRPLPTPSTGRMWGTDPDYILGPAGVQYDGEAWRTWQYSTSNDGAAGIWGTSVDDITIAAQDGGIYERVGTGSGWELVERVTLGQLFPDLYRVHGTASHRFIIGEYNVILHRRR